jgi:hypothetical protein
MYILYYVFWNAVVKYIFDGNYISLNTSSTCKNFSFRTHSGPRPHSLTNTIKYKTAYLWFTYRNYQYLTVHKTECQ